MLDELCNLDCESGIGNYPERPTVWRIVVLQDTTILERVGQNGLLDGCKYETNVAGIGGLRQMRVDAEPRPVGLCKSPKNVLCSLVDVRTAAVFGKVLG